jgi:Doubled CXXCH motif (Paired_CXXCH_1)
MSMNFQRALLALLLVPLLAAACAQATPPPTVAPPTAALIAPSATPVPPGVTPPPPTQPPAPPTVTPTPNPHVAGANCVACHTEEHKRWATTLHAADPAAVLTNQEHNTAELLTDECITCHAPFQAAEFHVGDFVQPVDQKGPWKVVDKNLAAWQAIKCETCHDPTSSAPQKLAFYDPAKQAYVPVKDSTELCEKCHQPGTDDSRDLKGSVHEGLQCATCHFQKGTEMSLDPKGSCPQCHPGVNPKHPDVTTLDTTLKSADSKNDIHFLTCKTCHPNGTPTPAP